MDRLWTALVLVAVLGMRGAVARDKTNMPKEKQEEGQPNNATALGTIVPDPSAGGRVDPEVLAGMYNRSMDVPIGDVPAIELDGETVANLTKKANTSAAKDTEWVLFTANGTEAKGDNLTASNATVHFDGANRVQRGAKPNMTGSATTQFDGVAYAQMGALLNATNTTNAAASKSITSSGPHSEYEGGNGPEPVTSGELDWHVGNETTAHIGHKHNTTNGANLPARSSAGNPTNTGSFPNASTATPVVQFVGEADGEIGPLNASASNSTGYVHPGHTEAWNGTLATGARPVGAYSQYFTGPLNATGPLVRPVQNGKVFIDVEPAAQSYRLAPGEDPQASTNRSNDPDVVAMKEIALVVLDGPKETAVIMTEVVIRSVLPDENVTMMKDTELQEVIQGKFQDEDLMRKIVEGDANQAHAIPEQGPCEDCPQPVSAICSLCWPADFCRPFASMVDIPCPLEQF